MAMPRGTIANLNDGVHFLAHRGVWIGKLNGKVVTTQSTKEKVELWLSRNSTTAPVVKLAKKVTPPVNDLAESIKTRVAQLTERANRLYSRLNMPNPTVSFYRRGRAAGRAYFTINTVAFNSVLAAENAATFDDTVIHEVGHLVTFQLYGQTVRPHGPEFKQICRALGGSGKTYHNYDVSSVSTNRKTAVVKCACRTHNVTPRKAAVIRNNPEAYVCKHCKTAVKAV